MKKQISFALILFVFACSSKQPSGPFFGNGVHNGWADQSSIVIWTRLTDAPEMNLSGEAFISISQKRQRELHKTGNKDSIHGAQIPVDLMVDDMYGACPGSEGEVKLVYYPEGREENMEEVDWQIVDREANFTKQWKLEGLEAGTSYELDVYSRHLGTTKIAQQWHGSFQTAPAPETTIPLSFCVVTCHDFIRRDDSIGGHRIYPAMDALQPDFFIHTGDVEYYDKKDPWAMTEELMRFKWDRLFALPFQRDFYSKYTSYFMKDDHDVLRDDAYPGMKYGTVSFERGLEIFDKEQFPNHPLRYKTIRWGQDLQIWIMEGRNYRTPNPEPDGPNKSIWGSVQKQWFFETLKKSDATFKIVVSSSPIIGPDRKNKNDNYSNAGFGTEGQEIRDYLNQFDNVFLINGDRHWQYVSHPEESNLWEFSTGAGADKHAGGWSQDDKRPAHRFLRVKGGFLQVRVSQQEGVSEVEFTHHDVDGQVVHRERFTR